ncbi:LCP family protein [Actinomadura latina]|uniref:LCP family protein n=1 Tax=Actinomadura latina TaxID=163603 RepID=A0A846YYQ6_9ACTN|nr:LCP family protein [Actinomadura latina]NKZ03922.1 LCP family protein [Actinomadura latina]
MSDKDPGRDDLARDKAAHTTPGTSGPTPSEEQATAGTAPDGTTAGEAETAGPAERETTSAAASRTSEQVDGTVDEGGVGADDDSSSADVSEPGDSTTSDGTGVGDSEKEDDAAARAKEVSSGGDVHVSRAAGAPGAELGDGDAARGEGDGADTSGRGGAKRSRRRKVLRRVALGVVVVMLLGGGGAAWLYHDIVGGIEQKHVSDKLGTDRPKKLNKSLNILLIGSDTRAGDNARYAADGISGARSDTTILLHLSPNRDQAVGISFPRDSMVKIPACKKEKGGTVPAQFGMLNAAFAYAGPTCTWKTLESLTGIHIDHFVQVDFAGFKRMVDALGGVEICVNKPVSDPRAELYLKAGKQTVKGEQALGYVRARYSLGNGSDLERIERQQKFMASVVDKATSGSVLTDPAKTYKFLKAATKSMTTDDDLDLAAMRKLADGLKGMSAGQVRFVTVPVERYAPDPNRVQWNQQLTKPMFEAIQNDSELPAEPAKPVKAGPPPPAPGKVHVTVVDAGGKGKLIQRVLKQLRQRGYKVAKKVEKGTESAESRLVYAPAAEAQASALARDLPDAMLTADAKAPQNGVRLVIGTSGVRLAPPAINKIGGGVKGGQNLCK